MPQLETLYRDIYSRLDLEGEDHSVYQDDIIKAINDTIRESRIRYVQNGLGSYFTVTETLTSFERDSDYPFLVSDSLSQTLLDETPEYMSVVASTSYITDKEIEDLEQSFSKGDIAFKQNQLYEAIEDFTDINTFALTFDPRKVRPYSSNNGLKYKTNQVVFKKDTGEYFRVTSDFVARNGAEELEKMYWKKIGEANTYTSHYPFSELRNLTVFESLQEPQAFTVKGNTVYATPAIKRLTLSYVPRWTDVIDFDDDVDIPDFMIGQIKARAIHIITAKLRKGVATPQPEFFEEPVEDDE